MTVGELADALYRDMRLGLEVVVEDYELGDLISVVGIEVREREGKEVMVLLQS